MEIEFDALHDDLGTPVTVILIWTLCMLSATFISFVFLFGIYVFLLSPLIGLSVLFTAWGLCILRALTLGK